MLYSRRPKYDAPYVVTGRKIAAYKRSCLEAQNKFPLLAPLIAETQRPVEEEMARRAATLGTNVDPMRQGRAKSWRNVRRAYYDLPPRVRALVRARWARWRSAHDPGYFGYVLRQTVAEVDVQDGDFDHVPAERRAEETRRLNDLARHVQDYPWANAERRYSRGALMFMAPGFEPHDGYEEPHVHLQTSRARYLTLNQVVSDYDGFSHNTDPTGLRERGVVECFGEELAFQVLTLRNKGEGPSPAPWNADYTRRIVFITGPDGR
jgi:hypothetical protein